MNFQDIRQLPDAAQNTAQLVDVADFDSEFHMCGMIAFIRIGIHLRYIDLFVGKHRSDITQQPCPVIGKNLNLDRIGVASARAPVDLDQTFPILGAETQYI